MAEIDRCWIVGFRYVYFDECVIEKQTFLGKLKGSYAVTAQPAETHKQKHLRRPLNFYYRTHVIEANSNSMPSVTYKISEYTF